MKNNLVLEDYLVKGAGEFGISITKEQAEVFYRYYKIVVEKNKNINLTSIEDEENFALKHFVDSLSAVSIIEMDKNFKMVDIGSGAGFPGIPIKILYPHLQLTLVESRKNKAEFLKEIVEKLHLKNCNVLHKRAEEIGQDHQYREFYDICVARAVASLQVLGEYCLPLVKPGGIFLSLKGPSVQEEIDESLHGLEILGGKIDDIYEFNLPFIGEKRSLVVVKKNVPTPLKYPRRPGMPEKRPIN